MIRGARGKERGLVIVLFAFVLIVLLVFTAFAIDRLHPAYAAVLGGLLLGAGCLFLARHRGSLGGATIVSLYMQEKHGWRAGKVQLCIDCSIVALAFLAIEPTRVLYSVLGSVVMSVFLAVNHKPGRYVTAV